MTAYQWTVGVDGWLWVMHDCTDHSDVWHPPSRWHVEGDRVVPSFSCQRCGAHEVLGPEHRVGAVELEAALGHKLDRLVADDES